MPTEKKTDLQFKKIRLDHIFPDNLKSHFVTNLVIQHQSDHFILSFFEAWPPPLLGETNDERRKELEKIDAIKATCVARLVLTPDKMRDFVNAMTNNLEQFETLQRLTSQNLEDE